VSRGAGGSSGASRSGTASLTGVTRGTRGLRGQTGGDAGSGLLGGNGGSLGGDNIRLASHNTVGVGLGQILSGRVALLGLKLGTWTRDGG
jgi:hypothetical protein